MTIPSSTLVGSSPTLPPKPSPDQQSQQNLKPKQEVNELLHQEVKETKQQKLDKLYDKVIKLQEQIDDYAQKPMDKTQKQSIISSFKRQQDQAFKEIQRLDPEPELRSSKVPESDSKQSLAPHSKEHTLSSSAKKVLVETGNIKYAAGKIPSKVVGLTTDSDGGSIAKYHLAGVEHVLGFSNGVNALVKDSKAINSFEASLAHHSQLHHKMHMHDQDYLAVTKHQQEMVLREQEQGFQYNAFQRETLQHIGEQHHDDSERVYDEILGHKAKVQYQEEKAKSAFGNQDYHGIKTARYLASTGVDAGVLASHFAAPAAGAVAGTVAKTVAAPVGLVAAGVSAKGAVDSYNAYHKAENMENNLREAAKGIPQDDKELQAIAECLATKQPSKTKKLETGGKVIDTLGYTVGSVGGGMAIAAQFTAVGAGVALATTAVVITGGVIAGIGAAIALGIGIYKGIKWYQNRQIKQQAAQELQQQNQQHQNQPQSAGKKQDNNGVNKLNPVERNNPVNRPQQTEPVQDVSRVNKQEKTHKAHVTLLNTSAKYSLANLYQRLQQEDKSMEGSKPAHEFCLKFMSEEDLQMMLNADEEKDALKLLSKRFNLSVF